MRRGFTSILSDTDVLNAPMIAAFERAGHYAGVRPWHVWHYRYPAAGLNPQREPAVARRPRAIVICSPGEPHVTSAPVVGLLRYDV